jgi:hypothetical protein
MGSANVANFTVGGKTTCAVSSFSIWNLTWLFGSVLGWLYACTSLMKPINNTSVADPGSGAFLPPGFWIRDPGCFYPGSRIRCFFSPRIPIRDGAMVGSGSGIKHPGSATLNNIKQSDDKQNLWQCTWLNWHCRDSNKIFQHDIGNGTVPSLNLCIHKNTLKYRKVNKLNCNTPAKIIKIPIYFITFDFWKESSNKLLKTTAEQYCITCYRFHERLFSNWLRPD